MGHLPTCTINISRQIYQSHESFVEYSTSLIRILSHTITLQQATKLYTPYAPCTEYLLHLASIYVTVNVGKYSIHGAFVYH